MTMGRFRMQPRKGHLERVARIFGFLRYYKSASIKFRVDMPDYLMYVPQKSDWKYVYGELKEELPSRMLEPKGNEVIVTAFCDANLNHDLITGRAVMSNIIMLNKTPTDWMSKRQATVETAMYGSDMVAMRVAVDQIVEWRYTLRMLGVPLANKGGPSYLFGDNKAVVDLSVIPDYNLKKRHHALCFHRVREAVASKIIQYYHISGKENPADVLTKFLPHAQWWPLMKPFLHWLDVDDDGTLLKTEEED